MSRVARRELLSPQPLSQGSERRRRQLIDAASRIIEREGVDALRMTRIAELAGCTRALVYRYFPTRQDIYSAIAHRFYEELDALLPLEEQSIGFTSASQPTAASKRLFDAAWAVMDRTGPAGVLLRCSPELSPEFAGYLSQLRDAYEGRFRTQFEAAGLLRREADLLIDLLSSTMKATAAAWYRGEMTQEEARDAHERASFALMRSFLGSAQQLGGAERAKARSD